ncbi:16S rRNA (cytidine(1402)-2'-O)-methyltransferase [Candidatus Uhrbacteria bacterium]|nr:16S rRNA (cytidine(1402)-2'-O)-methyltransferase [Candidatus Uhrbacteria bacterium]
MVPLPAILWQSISMTGTLFVVSTPIGNLDDVSPRAIATLRASALILCEDTRVTRKLLRRFEIATPTTSVHEHTRAAKLQSLSQRILRGASMALVSDAGTPGISDPGARLVAGLHPGVPVIPVPGPSAVTSILSVSGFSGDCYVFHGFPPHKKGRSTFWKQVADEKRTSVFFESPHRVEKAMGELAAICRPERRIVIGRELTKAFESVRRGTAASALSLLRSEPIKGEYVIALEGDRRPLDSYDGNGYAPAA